MRQTICFLLIISFLTQVNAQTYKILTPSVRLAKPSYKKSKLNADIFDTTSLKRLNSQSFIAKLKQDNMPCIIPIPLFPAIPNSYHYEKTYLGKIPNAWEKSDSTERKK